MPPVTIRIANCDTAACFYNFEVGVYWGERLNFNPNSELSRVAVGYCWIIPPPLRLAVSPEINIMSWSMNYILYPPLYVSLSLLSLQIPLYQRPPPDMKKVTANRLETFPRVPMASVLVRSFVVH